MKLQHISDHPRYAEAQLLLLNLWQAQARISEELRELKEKNALLQHERKISPGDALEISRGRALNVSAYNERFREQIDDASYRFNAVREAVNDQQSVINGVEVALSREVCASVLPDYVEKLRSLDVALGEVESAIAELDQFRNEVEARGYRIATYLPHHGPSSDGVYSAETLRIWQKDVRDGLSVLAGTAAATK